MAQGYVEKQFLGRIWHGAGCEALSEIEEQEDGTMVQELTAFVLHVTDLKDVVVKGETKKVCTVPWYLRLKPCVLAQSMVL